MLLYVFECCWIEYEFLWVFVDIFSCVVWRYFVLLFLFYLFIMSLLYRILESLLIGVMGILLFVYDRVCGRSYCFEFMIFEDSCLNFFVY